MGRGVLNSDNFISFSPKNSFGPKMQKNHIKICIQGVPKWGGSCVWEFSLLNPVFRCGTLVSRWVETKEPFIMSSCPRVLMSSSPSCHHVVMSFGQHFNMSSIMSPVSPQKLSDHQYSASSSRCPGYIIVQIANQMTTGSGLAS